MSVLSAWWRLWGRARLRSQSMSSWVDLWMPHNFYGGRAGVSASDALIPLLEAVDEGFYLGSLDFSLAFDSTDPLIPLHVFSRLGMPSGINSMLASVWTNQARYLQLAGDTDPEPCTVKSSLPQGDALSMLGLAATLLGPHIDISSRFPESIFSTYVDDRTFASPSADDCISIATSWAVWSNFLGLRENEDKSQFFQRTVKGRDVLSSVGAPPHRISTHPKILGVEFVPAIGRGITDDEAKRFRKATVAARRCSYLPHPPARKTLFASLTAVSIAKWGWLAKVPPKHAFSKLEAALRRCASEHLIGDPFLRKIFRGHLASPDFACFSAVVSAIYRFCKRRQTPFGSWDLKSGFAKSLRSFFSRYGCSVISPWTWCSNGALASRISLMPSSAWFASNAKLLQHLLREVWRKFLYAKWATRPRIDSHLAGQVPYSEHRCAAARNLAAQSSHHTAVLVGATVSPAKLSVMMQNPGNSRRIRRGPLPVFTCPFCHNEGADLHHVTWSCAQRRDEAGRPPPACPACPLQKRLGWPRRRPPDRSDRIILDWMAFCRKRILQERWQ